MAKNRDDFTDSEIKKIHAEVEAAKTTAERDAIYKKHHAMRQAFSSWFKAEKLPMLSKAKTSKKLKVKTIPKAKPAVRQEAKQKKGAKGKSKANPSSPSTVRQPAAKPKSTGVSSETKELIARALLKLLED